MLKVNSMPIPIRTKPVPIQLINTGIFVVMAVNPAAMQMGPIRVKTIPEKIKHAITISIQNTKVTITMTKAKAKGSAIGAAQTARTPPIRHSVLF